MCVCVRVRARACLCDDRDDDGDEDDHDDDDNDDDAKRRKGIARKPRASAKLPIPVKKVYNKISRGMEAETLRAGPFELTGIRL